MRTSRSKPARRESDSRPYKLWRVNSTDQNIELIGEYATLEQMRAQERHSGWRYFEFYGRTRIS